MHQIHMSTGYHTMATDLQSSVSIRVHVSNITDKMDNTTLGPFEAYRERERETFFSSTNILGVHERCVNLSLGCKFCETESERRVKVKVPLL